MELKLDSIGNFEGTMKSLLPMIPKIFSVIVALFFVLTSAGCIMSSISESSDSSSDSSKGSSKSSKSSSGESKEAFLRDVKQYTAAYTRTNSDMTGLPKGLSTISERHGVTDWESYSTTYVGIGEGFAKAALTKEQVDLYSSYLAHGDQLKIAAIQHGFISVR